jgi:hypothetical protein
MNPAEQTFINRLLELAGPAPDAPPAGQSPGARAFVDGLLQLLQADPPAPPALTPEQRAFVGQLLSIAPARAPQGDPGEVFERVIIQGWKQLTHRVQGAVAADLAELDEDQHYTLRVLEDSPSLLGPLGLAADERAHCKLLEYALGLSGPLGDQLRQAFLLRIGAEQRPSDWTVSPERVVAQGCRVDLELRIPGRWCCWIEAKVNAVEREDQLADYRRHLDEVGEAEQIEVALVFLTIDGRPGQAEGQALPLRYLDLVQAWAPLVRGPGAEAIYLRLWLRSLAELSGLTATGPSARWPLAQRANALKLLAERTRDDFTEAGI